MTANGVIMPSVSGPHATSADDIRRLNELAIESLPYMRIPNDPGLFAFELYQGESAPRGRSLRYTLMALLGLLKAQANGYASGWDLEPIHAALAREIDSPELDPGDYGLYLWVDARTGAGRAEELTGRLERSLDARGGLPARLGMEMGWIVKGLAEHMAAGGSQGGERLLVRALEQLLMVNRAKSALFRHHGAPGWRRRFPNFATQIYAVQALTAVARHGLDERALPAARAAADRLLELQLPDGGWPWLFDVERGTVVERYEIYCVHQHAMAPMALLDLAEVTGDARYVDAVAHGLRWIWGQNELGHDMVDPSNHVILRSIRRRRGPDRLWLAAKTAASRASLPTPGSTAKLTELNPTDRPYSMGWILEAWAGRESAVEA
jgi:hypothetical protein